MKAYPYIEKGRFALMEKPEPKIFSEHIIRKFKFVLYGTEKKSSKFKTGSSTQFSVSTVFLFCFENCVLCLFSQV